MMKKITFLLAAITLLLNTSVLAQNSNDCAIVYNLFKGEVQTKKYDAALPRLKKLMNDCPDLSVNIYKLGDRLAKDQLKSGGNKDEFIALSKKIYEQRLKYFPKNAAKVHSDFATFLANEKAGSGDEIFALL
ncbi:MAG: hypothetical protein ACI8WA_000770, partial [Polaribacter sp.]